MLKQVLFGFSLFQPSCLLPIWISQTRFSVLHSLFSLFQLVLANFSVGYVPLLLLTEYKLLRHPFSLPRKTWLMKSHSSHLRHAVYKKQGQREILSSWLIKCVVGGVICHSPVVIPRWGRVNQFFDAYLSLISSGSKYLEFTCLKCRLSRRIFGCFMKTDWLAKIESLVLRVWNLRLIGTHFIPNRLKFLIHEDYTDDYRMTIVEFLIKIIDEHKTWITWFSNVTKDSVCFIFMLQWDVSCK